MLSRQVFHKLLSFKSCLLSSPSTMLKTWARYKSVFLDCQGRTVKAGSSREAPRGLLCQSCMLGMTATGVSFILELSVSLAHFTPLKDSGTLYPYPELSLPVSPMATSFQSCLFLFSVPPSYMGSSLGDKAQLNPVYPRDKEHLYIPRGWWT